MSPHHRHCLLARAIHYQIVIDGAKRAAGLAAA
jgi:hypothetical protein